MIKESSLNFGSPLLMTVEAAAEMLAIGRTRAYELVMSGQVRSVKIGRSRLVIRESLQEYVDRLLEEQHDSDSWNYPLLTRTNG